MFGNPDWFRERRIGWGVVPVTWRGWGYSAVWLMVLTGPFAALLARQQAVEAMIWLVASAATLGLDVRQILKAKRRVGEDVEMYLGEEETEAERLATQHYNLQLRRPASS